MTPPTVTMLYASLLAALYLALALRVSLRRRAAGIDLGDGGDVELMRRIRAHGNFAEYVPFVLLLMAMAELGGAGHILLHVLGIALVAGRLCHAWGIGSSSTAARVIGMLLTFAVFGVAGVVCFLRAIWAY
ncbi:MAG: MAPEG family protein [Proteobacteria bacterium]|nr:MAPEG family protein [Pseudomonadota bacterium]